MKDAPNPARKHQVRVLMLIDGLGPGGKERQTAALAKGLVEQPGIEPLLLSLNKGGRFEADLRQHGVPVICLQRKIRWDPLLLVRLLRLTRKFRPSIIHTTCTMTSFYALPAARLLGAVLVNGSIRNAFQPPFRHWRLERLLLQLSDFRVANSEAGLRSRGLLGDDRRNWVVYNGFEFERLQKTGLAPLRLPGTEGKKRVGMLANFSDYKDYDTYLEASRQILERRRDVVFLAAGAGKNLDRCRQWVYSRGLQDIHLLGRSNAVECFVLSLDVGVLATYSEGISNSVMEYMACGKPAVVTQGGGSSELVLEGETGFLVPSRDPSLLAERIELLLDNPDLSRRMGGCGRRRIEEHFSRRRMVEKTLRLYEQALRSCRESGPRAQSSPSEYFAHSDPPAASRQGDKK